MVITKVSRSGRLHLFLWPLCLLSLFQPGSLHGTKQKTDRSRTRSLHTLVLEVDLPPPAGGYMTRGLDSTDFPEALSVAIFSSSMTLVPESDAKYGLPEKASFLEAFVLEATTEEIEENKKLKRRDNKVINLKYQVRLSEWNDTSYRLELNGSFRGSKIGLVKVLLPADQSSILHVGGRKNRRLLYVFTPLDMIGLMKSGTRVEGQSIEEPKILEKLNPAYPKEAIEKRKESTLVLRTVVTKSGRIDPSRVLLLHCDHPSFAIAMASVLDKWKFEPGRRNGVPIDFRATLQAEFKFQ